MYKQKMNKELKDYLYMLTGNILTINEYRKILDYFNQLKLERDHYKNKTLKLQERIVNAIILIEKLKNDDSSYYDETIINTIRNLLDILKGKDNND